MEKCYEAACEVDDANADSTVPRYLGGEVGELGFYGIQHRIEVPDPLDGRNEEPRGASGRVVVVFLAPTRRRWWSRNSHIVHSALCEHNRADSKNDLSGLHYLWLIDVLGVGEPDYLGRQPDSSRQHSSHAV